MGIMYVLKGDFESMNTEFSSAHESNVNHIEEHPLTENHTQTTAYSYEL